MHIILDGRLILAQQTGIGRYLIGLLSGIQKIPCEDQLEVWLQKNLPADHPVWRLEAPNINLRSTPLRHMDLRAQSWAPAEIRRVKPDLYHYPHFDLPWLTAGKIVLTLYDLKYLSRPDYFVQKGGIKRWLMKRMLLHAVRQAQQVITISQFSALDLHNRLGIDPQKIRVTSLGVDARFFQRSSPQELEDVRRRYHLAPQYILFVGERRPHKNLTGLIQAFARLQTSDSSAQLVIAGKAYANFQAPQTLVERLGLSSRVRFLDYVEDQDLPALYQAAGVFCLLSEYEGFGLPILEAMASQTPVVAANRTALPEILAGAGLLVDPAQPEAAAQAVVSLLSDPTKRTCYTELGLARANQFRWENCARQTLDVYHEAKSE